MGRDEPVLIVDDDAAVRTTLRDLCEQAGRRVISTGSAAEALTAAQRDVPMAAIIDWRLGRATARPLIEALKKLDQSMPVIIYTGWAEDTNLMANDVGAAAVVQKGRNPNELMDLIDAEFRRREMEPGGGRNGEMGWLRKWWPQLAAVGALIAIVTTGIVKDQQHDKAIDNLTMEMKAIGNGVNDIKVHFGIKPAEYASKRRSSPRGDSKTD